MSENNREDKIVEEHTKWFVSTIEKIYSDALRHGYKHGFEDGKKENEEECWFVSFNKASTQEAVIQITGGAKETDGLVEGMVPGKTTIPCIQTSLKRVFAKPLKGRKVTTSKYYYTDGLARKHDKENLRPDEFRMDEGYDLDRRFKENFDSLVELSEEEPPLIKQVTLEGKSLDREIFRVSEVE